MAAFCSNCGTQVPGAFCPNCGTPVSTANAGPATGAYVPPSAPPRVVTVGGGLEAHVASALCYTPFFVGLICCIVFLVVAPFNQIKFVRFSAFQSLFLHLAMAVLYVVLGVFSGIFHLFILMLLSIASLVLFLFMMYKSFNNQMVKLPFIGDMADKQA